MAIAYGIPEYTFFHSTPKRLKLIYEEIQLRKDYEMWMMGQYVSQSLMSTVCNGFIWRNKGDKPYEYPNTPFLYEKSKNKENTKPQEELTEEEKKQKTENLFMLLRVMGANHKLSKNDKGDTV